MLMKKVLCIPLAGFSFAPLRKTTALQPLLRLEFFAKMWSPSWAQLWQPRLWFHLPAGYPIYVSSSAVCFTCGSSYFASWGAKSEKHAYNFNIPYMYTLKAWQTIDKYLLIVNQFTSIAKLTSATELLHDRFGNESLFTF